MIVVAKFSLEFSRRRAPRFIFTELCTKSVKYGTPIFVLGHPSIYIEEPFISTFLYNELGEYKLCIS